MKINRSLLGISAFAILACASEAAIVQEVKTFSSVVLGSSPFTITVNKFNGSLGILQSIDFKLEATTSGTTLVFDNESPSNGTVNLSVGAEIKAKTGIALITDVVLTPSKTGSGSVVADNDGPPNFGGTDSFSISTGVLNASDSVLRTAPQYLTQFTASPGQTNYVVTFSNSISSSQTTSGIVGSLNSTAGTFSGKLTVTYTYSPIPEPGSAVWGLAVGMFAGLRRVRSRKA